MKVKEDKFKFIGWRLIRSVLTVNKEPVPHRVLPYSSSLKSVLRAKVARSYEEEDKVVLNLNKGNVQIWITDNPEAESLKSRDCLLILFL